MDLERLFHNKLVCILSSAYALISGDAGTLRHLDRARSLHSPYAIVSKNVNAEDREVLTLDQFYDQMGDRRESGFFEEEINREVRIFGSIAHVWSTYRIRYVANGPVVSRGINSIQLYYSDNRWWILSWNWDVEKEGEEIPATFDSN